MTEDGLECSMSNIEYPITNVDPLLYPNEAALGESRGDAELGPGSESGVSASLRGGGKVDEDPASLRTMPWQERKGLWRLANQRN
jgi:hypothetical protein